MNQDLPLKIDIRQSAQRIILWQNKNRIIKWIWRKRRRVLEKSLTSHLNRNNIRKMWHWVITRRFSLTLNIRDSLLRHNKSILSKLRINWKIRVLQFTQSKTLILIINNYRTKINAWSRTAMLKPSVQLPHQILSFLKTESDKLIHQLSKLLVSILNKILCSRRLSLITITGKLFWLTRRV